MKETKDGWVDDEEKSWETSHLTWLMLMERTSLLLLSTFA